jgi:uncharacterized protein involved in exopolysaccharide biosynthesis
MSVYDDEIDLRPYINAIRQKWWLILLITVLGGAAALVAGLIQVRNYQASANILLTRSRASLELANQFPTVSEPIDTRSRMDAMLAIAGSDALVIQTLEDVHEQYPDNGILREELDNSVEITSSGDTIEITATHPDPVYSAAIANAWAANAVSAINYAYSGEQLPAEIQQSLEPAKMEYEAAQVELEDFLVENQVDILQKQIVETSALLDELVQDRTWKIAYNVQRKRNMEQIIDRANALKEQLSSRSTTTAAGLGEALAVLRLGSDAFGEVQIQPRSGSSSRVDSDELSAVQETFIVGAQQPDTIFDVQTSELIEGVSSGESYQRDLDRIIESAENEKLVAEAALLELTEASLDTGGDELLVATSEQLRQLQSELEREQARLNQLTSTRDLAWDAYQALAQKETEVRNNLQTSSSVTLASPAVPPVEPTSRGILRNTLIGAAIGLFLSLTWVLGSVWLASLDDLNDSQSEHH